MINKINQEWFGLEDTKIFMALLEEKRVSALEAVVGNRANRDEQCGIVKGIALAKSLLESAKEDSE